MTTVSQVVHSDPDILGGTPVFVGTRVPVRTLLDYLAAGDSLEEFLDHFPTVTREQAVAGASRDDILLDDTRFPSKIPLSTGRPRFMFQRPYQLASRDSVMAEGLSPVAASIPGFT